MATVAMVAAARQTAPAVAGAAGRACRDHSAGSSSARMRYSARRASSSTLAAAWTCSSVPAWTTCMTAAPTPKISVRSSAACGAAAADLLPRRAELVAVLGDVRAARVGELEQPAAAGVLRADEALVLELRERRVDGAGARAPVAAAAVLDLLHQPVAVARLLGEQDEQRGPDVAAPGARAAAPEAGPERPERGAAEAGAAVAPAVPVPAAAAA